MDVIIDQKIKGVSGTGNQCDVIIKSNNMKFNFLGIIECKDYNKKIGISFLREFKSKIEDIKATAGIFVTTIGYTSESIKYAKYHNIKTFTLFDANNIHWKQYAFIPILIKFIFIKKYSIQFKKRRTNKKVHTFIRGNKETGNKQYILDNSKVTVERIISDLWNTYDFHGNDKISLKSKEQKLKDPDTNENIICEAEISTRIENRILYITVLEGRGFKSEDKIVAKEFKTKFFNTDVNQLYSDSKKIRKNISTEFQLKIVERIIDDPHYRLPKQIRFKRINAKNRIEKNW